jgi:hypothetical protein
MPPIPHHFSAHVPGLKVVLFLQEYVCPGRAPVIEGQPCLPDGQPTPDGDTGHGLKFAIDSWLSKQNQSAAPAKQDPFCHKTPPAMQRVVCMLCM